MAEAPPPPPRSLWCTFCRQRGHQMENCRLVDTLAVLNRKSVLAAAASRPSKRKASSAPTDLRAPAARVLPHAPVPA